MKKALLLIIAINGLMAHETFMVFGGKTGWIGQKIVALLIDQGYEVHVAQSRLEDRASILAEIDVCRPTCIINAAGVTGRPNVDWCEDHKIETVRSNLIGSLTLFDCAHERGVHVINFGTGCIFEYDEQHSCGSGCGFIEAEAPNFDGSFYSFTKGIIDQLIDCYPNVLNLRLRMPISDDLHPRSFVTKITRYQKVVNIPNSMTVLHDLLPLIPLLAQKRLSGNLNFVNPGAISHNEILDLYKKYIDPDFAYTNFTIEEHDTVVKARRSNNYLDTTLLTSIADVPEIHEAMEALFQRMAQALYSNKAAMRCGNNNYCHIEEVAPCIQC